MRFDRALHGFCFTVRSRLIPWVSGSLGFKASGSGLGGFWRRGFLGGVGVSLGSEKVVRFLCLGLEAAGSARHTDYSKLDSNCKPG